MLLKTSRASMPKAARTTPTMSEITTNLSITASGCPPSICSIFLPFDPFRIFLVCPCFGPVDPGIFSRWLSRFFISGEYELCRFGRWIFCFLRVFAYTVCLLRIGFLGDGRIRHK